MRVHTVHGAVLLQVREEELDAMMAHLGGQKVEVPELLFAPECVEMAELRKKWDAIAALATEEGAPEEAEAARPDPGSARVGR